MRTYLKNLAIHHEGDYHKIKKSIANKESVPRYQSDFKYLCIGDANYPKQLYDLKTPPFVIFYIGNISLLKKQSIGIVGSRNPSYYAKKHTELLVRNLRETYVVVSGLAKGIDAISHEQALDFSTIAVLGCGIDVIYPKCNVDLFKKMKEKQLILSEYPQGVKPRPYFFPFRNRIIAALSERLFVMSAALKSGTMTTVNEALMINRHVLCLPHPINDKSGEGCNQLILEGADILTSVYDL